MVTGKKGGGPTFGKSSQIIPYFFFPEVTPFLMVIGWYDININIEIFKFEYLNVSMTNLGFGIFKFENRDIQI